MASEYVFAVVDSKDNSMVMGVDANGRLIIPPHITRAALRKLSNEPGCGYLFGLLAQSASDEALSKLWTLIKEPKL